jgi:hypothetical protein
MFERNKVDSGLQQTSVPAEIVLMSGETLKGRFVINAQRSIYDILNGGTQFIEFETYTGQSSLLAKSSLSSIKVLNVPGASNLRNRVRTDDEFDPHQILGVTAATSFDAIRLAYLALSKIYHPDRFAGVELPKEVKDYLAAMARRVNSAYAALEAPHQSQKRAETEKAKPIFTSTGLATSRPFAPVSRV